MIQCRRCLLKDIDKDEYFANVYEYISLIPENIKADDKLYRSRLDVCRTCDMLINGMCGECGCYVEMRAAKKENYCPSADKKW